MHDQIGKSELRAAPRPEDRRDQRPVCVTGCTGFIAASVVERLLEEGFTVRGTTSHDPLGPETEHLRAIRNAQAGLKIFRVPRVDGVLDRRRLEEVLSGCDAVVHMSTPVEIPLSGEETKSEEEAELSQLRPAVEGLRVVLESCQAVGTETCVLTSSGTAVHFLRTPPSSGVVTEECWSDEDFLREQGLWYMLAKTRQERLAWELSEELGIRLGTVCPSIVWGERRTKHLNFSHAVLLEVLKGAHTSVPVPPAELAKRFLNIVDVEDAAEIHVQILKKKLTGRFLAFSDRLPMRTLCMWLRKWYPDLAARVPDLESEEPPSEDWRVDRSRSEAVLGRKYCDSETLVRKTMEGLIRSGAVEMEPKDRVMACTRKA